MKHYGRLGASRLGLVVGLIVGLVFGLVLSAAPVEARKNPCSPKRCKPSIKARCAGFKKKAKRDCRRGIISLCKSGQCSCTAAPSCAEPTTTSIPTTTSTTTTSSTSSSTSTTTLMSGACLRDIGDDTIYDVCSGLQWEKKASGLGLHDAAALYAWAGCCDGDCSIANLCQPNAAAAATCAASSDGGTQGCSTCASGTCNVDVDMVGVPTTVWDWINQLNAANFAGHNDWRLPSQAGSNTVSAATELEALIALTAPGCGIDMPCIDPIFGPTTADAYFSATTITSSTGMAWVVDFSAGNVGSGSKEFGFYVRAVR